MNPIKSLANLLLEASLITDPALAVVLALSLSFAALIALVGIPTGILYLINEKKSTNE